MNDGTISDVHLDTDTGNLAVGVTYDHTADGHVVTVTCSLDDGSRHAARPDPDHSDVLALLLQQAAARARELEKLA